MTGVLRGPDGQLRCPWSLSAPEYVDYHDLEWGRPVGDDRAVFQKLCLEGFQAGLSWLTILRKRESFRRAFAGFEPEAVARFGSGDVERLLSDTGIVRHRAKIEATIANAAAMIEIAAQGQSLAGLIWAHEPARGPVPASTADLPGATAASRALSADLRRSGFRFVGPTTAYSAMQSLGVVNDHLEGCHIRVACASERAAFTRPTRTASG